MASASNETSARSSVVVAQSASPVSQAPRTTSLSSTPAMASAVRVPDGRRGARLCQPLTMIETGTARPEPATAPAMGAASEVGRLSMILRQADLS